MDVSAVGLRNGTTTPRENWGGGRKGELWAKTYSWPAKLPCFLSFSAARDANSLTASSNGSSVVTGRPKDRVTAICFLSVGTSSSAMHD